MTEENDANDAVEVNKVNDANAGCGEYSMLQTPPSPYVHTPLASYIIPPPTSTLTSVAAPPLVYRSEGRLGTVVSSTTACPQRLARAQCLAQYVTRG